MTMGDQAGEGSAPAAGSKGLSFGFSKKLTNKVQKADQTSWKKDKDSHPDETSVDLVKEVNAKGVQSTKAPEIKKAAVIPCPGNKYKLKAPEGVKEVSAEQKLAEQELIADSKKWLEASEARDDDDGARKTTGTIPLSQEEREKRALDSDLKENAAEVSSMDDYEDTPVAGFGMAMLRGMGFDPKVGVGGFNKAVVECMTPDVRPKGLGLGAQRPNTGGDANKQGGQKNGSEEDLTMKKGAYVVVESGKNKGSYGKVEGLDEESARVIVKLSVGNDGSVSLSENCVRVVGKDEYKKFSRVINKDAYEEYAKKQQEREIQWDKDGRKNGHDERNGDSNSQRESKSKKSSRRSPDRDSLKRRRSRSRSPEVPSKKSAPPAPRDTWLRPNLRVRLIDEDSKYYNTKVRVEDVVSPYSCVVRTESGRVLDDVDPRDCETIVPKSDLALVMIVRGKRKGRLAEILGRDKHKSRAALQLLPDKDEVLKMDYDDICEYLGDSEDVYS